MPISPETITTPPAEVASPSVSSGSKRGFKLSRTAVLIGVCALLALAVAYLSWQNYRLQRPEAQQEIAKQANDDLVREVGATILLPDETPNIASIVDVDSLRKANADFYKDAQNGDKLLIYSSKAIIYRESEGQIINVAPVKLTPQEASKDSS